MITIFMITNNLGEICPKCQSDRVEEISTKKKMVTNTNYYEHTCSRCFECGFVYIIPEHILKNHEQRRLSSDMNIVKRWIKGEAVNK